MDKVHQWHSDAIGEATAKALCKNEFDAHYVKTSALAVEIIKKYLKKDATIGFGGSMTVASLGIKKIAEDLGCNVLDHNKPGLSPEEAAKIRKQQLICNVFISSSNAITLDGEIYNIDGNGNRVAALTYGPDKTIVVVGINKIVTDSEAAFERMESIASPMNCKRLERATPCTQTGYCVDCDSKARICRIYQILRKKPFSSDFTVIIVGEELGY